MNIFISGARRTNSSSMMQKHQESDHNSTGHFLHEKRNIRKIFTQEIPAANVPQTVTNTDLFAYVMMRIY